MTHAPGSLAQDMMSNQAVKPKDVARLKSMMIRRLRLSKPAQYVVFGVIGTIVSIAISTYVVIFGIGMSRQDEDVALNGALASLFAIAVSFIIIRRLLSFPLLRTYKYVALTFVGVFLLVAVGLKFLRIDFSSPQFFLTMIIIIGLIESFFYFHRHAAPVHIAILPGVSKLAKLPRRHFRLIKYSHLAAVPIGEFNFNGVVADFNLDLEPTWQHFLAMAALQGIPVYDVKYFNESINGRVAIDNLRENTFGAVVPALIYPQFKRSVDFLAALLLAPLILLIVGVCAILIKFDSPGPIFFRQQRVGLGGRQFDIFKLRTMTHNHNGVSYTAPNDKRISRVGRALRRFRLDELPQLINILRGDMTWIGPRPEALELAEWYEREIPFYVYRHIVRPGITGWAQVHQGNVAEIDAARLKLQYDFFYIKHFSFWLDLVIFFKTLRTILTGFGSR